MLRRMVVLSAAVVAGLMGTFAGAGEVKVSKGGKEVVLNVPEAGVDHAGLKKLGWKLACQFWTFREYTAYETIDILHAMGVHHAEFYPGQMLMPGSGAHVGPEMSEEEIEGLKKKLKEVGMAADNFGVADVNKGEEDARKIFEFAKKMGIKTIVAEPKDQEVFKYLDKLTEEYKINISIHDHPKPSHYWNPETVLAAIEGHSNRIGACADIGHFVRSGLSSLESVKKLEGHIISLHMKDVMPEPGGGGYAGFGDVVWGTGKVDVAAVMAELKRQGFKGVMSIEYEKTTGQELVDNVEKSIAFFSGEVKKLASGDVSADAAQKAASEEGWTELFDGTDMKGWHAFKGGEPKNWEAKDGVMINTEHGPDLVSDGEYGNYVLEMDFKMPAKGNSGIIYRCDESSGAVWHTGPEYQLWDNMDTAGTGLHDCAAVYDLYPPTTNAAKPAGEWNHAKLVVDGDHVEHWLNGTKVAEYDFGSEDWKEHVEKSKFKDRAKFGKLAKGHIALQGDHSPKIEFKNVKIKELKGQ